MPATASMAQRACTRSASANHASCSLLAPRPCKSRLVNACTAVALRKMRGLRPRQKKLQQCAELVSCIIHTRGSKPKSPGRLPSRCAGGVPPGSLHAAQQTGCQACRYGEATSSRQSPQTAVSLALLGPVSQTFISQTPGPRWYCCREKHAARTTEGGMQRGPPRWTREGARWCVRRARAAASRGPSLKSLLVLVAEEMLSWTVKCLHKSAASLALPFGVATRIFGFS